MTPEESKAKELVDKFYPFTLYTDVTLNGKRNAYNRAKQCAIICIDEIIDANPYYFYPDRKITRISDHSTKDFWQKVKEEINNL